MPGAGKTTVATALGAAGFQTISMGDVVREEAKRRGLPMDAQTLGKIMVGLREERGPGAIAHLIAEKISRGSANHVVIDGLRSMQEVDVLRKHGTIKILAIHAPKQARFGFLKGRGRGDAPDSEEEFDLRDKRELGVGIGEAISFSDSIIMNDGTIEDLKRKAVEIAGRWKEEVEAGS
jgi:dephospho-CoA kinase